MWPRRGSTERTRTDSRPNAAVIAAHGGKIALDGSAKTGEADSTQAEIAAFDALRAATYKKMGREIAHRIATNPTPTTEERNIGTYIEAIEPQVRSAIMTMRRKGYNTTGSGFHGTDDDWRVLGIDNPARTYDPANRRGQFMDFVHGITLSDDTIAALHTLGAEVPAYPGLEGKVLRIGFTPASPDLAAIEAQWNAIADVLPDTGTPAGPRMGSLEATGFYVYCPPDVNWPVGDFNAAAVSAAVAMDIAAASTGAGPTAGPAGAPGGGAQA